MFYALLTWVFVLPSWHFDFCPDVIEKYKYQAFYIKTYDYPDESMKTRPLYIFCSLSKYEGNTATWTGVDESAEYCNAHLTRPARYIGLTPTQALPHAQRTTLFRPGEHKIKLSVAANRVIYCWKVWLFFCWHQMGIRALRPDREIEEWIFRWTVENWYSGKLK